MTKIKDIICPTCGKKDTWTAENKFRPFCSERCKLIDLGDWADEKFRVPGEDANIQDGSSSDDKDQELI